MTIHDFPSVRDATFSESELDELIYSQHAGESELHWRARITRMACEHWLIATRHLEMGRLNGNNSDTMRHYESRERKTKHTMHTFALMLVEALTEKAA